MISSVSMVFPRIIPFVFFSFPTCKICFKSFIFANPAVPCVPSFFLNIIPSVYIKGKILQSGFFFSGIFIWKAFYRKNFLQYFILLLIFQEYNSGILCKFTVPIRKALCQNKALCINKALCHKKTGKLSQKATLFAAFVSLQGKTLFIWQIKVAKTAKAKLRAKTKLCA